MLTRHFRAVVEDLTGDGEPYGELSVERIITTGGVSRSTFYSYFDDKGDLLSAMAHDVISDLVDIGHMWWELPHDATKRDLREALRGPVNSYRAHRTIYGAVVETAPFDARVHEQQRYLTDHVTAALASHISDAQKAGTAAPELDPRRTAGWIIWMLEHGLYQLLAPAGQREADRLLAAATDIVWRALYAGYRDEG